MGRDPDPVADPRAPRSFRAYVVDSEAADLIHGVATIDRAELPDNELVIRVSWSGVNYKDALTTRPGNRIAKRPRLIPGTDLAGVVVESRVAAIPAGTEIIAHGFEIGVSQHGGFAEYASVPAAWTTPLPDGLTAKEAMSIGTAGVTAAAMVLLLESRGIRPGSGPVVVTGASGGVGSIAVELLVRRGFAVDAVTNKTDSHARLKELGATDILSPATLRKMASAFRRQRWAAAIDVVGTATIDPLLRTLRRGGILACTGNTSGGELVLGLKAFHERGVELVGVPSTRLEPSERVRLWHHLATDLRPTNLMDSIATTSLDGLADVLALILDGKAIGRWLVQPGPDIKQAGLIGAGT